VLKIFVDIKLLLIGVEGA